MPIPGTDILTTAELAGRMISEGRADTLAAADRVRRAEVENERLRELLAVARDALRAAVVEINDMYSGAAVEADTAWYHDALRRSDPEATAAGVSDAD